MNDSEYVKEEYDSDGDYFIAPVTRHAMDKFPVVANQKKAVSMTDHKEKMSTPNIARRDFWLTMKKCEEHHVPVMGAFANNSMMTDIVFLEMHDTLTTYMFVIRMPAVMASMIAAGVSNDRTVSIVPHATRPRAYCLTYNKRTDVIMHVRSQGTRNNGRVTGPTNCMCFRRNDSLHNSKPSDNTLLVPLPDVGKRVSPFIRFSRIVTRAVSLGLGVSVRIREKVYGDAKAADTLTVNETHDAFVHAYDAAEGLFALRFADPQSLRVKFASTDAWTTYSDPVYTSTSVPDIVVFQSDSALLELGDRAVAKFRALVVVNGQPGVFFAADVLVDIPFAQADIDRETAALLLTFPVVVPFNPFDQRARRGAMIQNT